MGRRRGPVIEIEILGERPSGFVRVRCVVCGTEVALDRAGGYDVPIGWLALDAAHWPAGTDLGPLCLRICRDCLNWALQRRAARDGRRL